MPALILACNRQAELDSAPDPELLSGVEKERAESTGDTGLGVAGQQGDGPIDAPLR